MSTTKDCPTSCPVEDKIDTLANKFDAFVERWHTTQVERAALDTKFATLLTEHIEVKGDIKRLNRFQTTAQVSIKVLAALWGAIVVAIGFLLEWRKSK